MTIFRSRPFEEGSWMLDQARRTRRYAVLTEGFLTDPSACKTGYGVMRFRPDEVAAVVDSTHTGRRVRDVVPALQCDAPIVATVQDALAFKPTSLLIGVATHGGALPPSLRGAILAAIDSRLEIVNGLHTFLNDDDEFVAHARRSRARLWDVRDAGDIPIFSGDAYNVPQNVVLAVGSDCAVGKMTATLAIERAAQQAGTRAEFIPTGQTGIMIAGWGIAVDAVISDFVTGAAEQLVLGASPESEVLLVEGQASIFHPAYAPVTFGLLYGCAPDALFLCHRPNLTHLDGYPSSPVPPLRSLIASHEAILANVKPARIAAIALDTSALDESDAARAAEEIERETGLAAADPVRGGARKLWDAIAGELARSGKRRLSLRS